MFLTVPVPVPMPMPETEAARRRINALLSQASQKGDGLFREEDRARARARARTNAGTAEPFGVTPPEAVVS